MSPRTMAGNKSHKLQKVNKKGKKSGKKYKKLYEWMINVLQKQKKNGETNWVKATKEKIYARMDKYGVTEEQMKEYISDKGKDELVDMV